MKIRISAELAKELRRLKKQNPQLIRQVNKQLKIFAQNPKHPSLRTHKLAGKLENMWSISITRSIRMVYIFLDKNEAYFIDIGTHKEVYRK